MVHYPEFTDEELLEMQEDARSALLNEVGALENPGHWLGAVIDTCRYARTLKAELAHERMVRLGRELGCPD